MSKNIHFTLYMILGILPIAHFALHAYVESAVHFGLAASILVLADGHSSKKAVVASRKVLNLETL